MKNVLTLTFFFLLISQVNSQSKESWKMFKDHNTGLLGYKNQNNEVVIKPKLNRVIANNFDHIIAVYANEHSYYYTKNGRKIGVDSLYYFDNEFDCESEGFIRFRNNQTDKVGMLNANGDVVIPAVYDQLSKVHNGMVWSMKNAKKSFWDNHNESGCNHYTWEEGEESILSVKHNTLINNIKYNYFIDLYSLKIEDQPTDDATRRSFKGVNNQFYTFINQESEFYNWLMEEFLPDLTKQKMKLMLTDHPWSYVDRRFLSHDEFIRLYYDQIINKLKLRTSPATNYFIKKDGLSRFSFKSDNKSLYFDNCGEANIEKYPVMCLLVNQEDEYMFLRTDEGYKLLGVTFNE